MKALREHYNGSSKGKRHIYITKENLKELYFKHEGVFPFEKYVNRLKEAYNTLEELNQPNFEKQQPCLTTSCALMIKLNPVCTLPINAIAEWH